MWPTHHDVAALYAPTASPLTMAWPFPSERTPVNPMASRSQRGRNGRGGRAPLALMKAERGLTSLKGCGRWLPDSLTSLTFE